MLGIERIFLYATVANSLLEYSYGYGDGYEDGDVDGDGFSCSFGIIMGKRMRIERG